MLTVYLNYPKERKERIFIHRKSDCSQIQKKQKPNQRKVDINSQNVDAELQRFNEYRFEADAKINDMWVRVSLDNEVSERRVIDDIKKILGGRYKRFRDAKIKDHVCRP